MRLCRRIVCAFGDFLIIVSTAFPKVRGTARRSRSIGPWGENYRFFGSLALKIPVKGRIRASQYMKTKSETSTYTIRSATIAVLLLFALVTLTSAFNSPNKSRSSSWPFHFSGGIMNSAKRAETLTFADRVAYQRAIEEVYWRHRIWPKERPDPKPSLDQVMPRAQLEKKVEKYYATLKHWKTTGGSRLVRSSCRLKWSAWQSTPSSPKSRANSSRR